MVSSFSTNFKIDSYAQCVVHAYILVPRSLRQEDCGKFAASQGYKMRATLSQPKQTKQNDEWRFV